MASPVVGVVLIIGITCLSFGSMVAFAATDFYAKGSSCEAQGSAHDLYDNTECPKPRVHHAPSARGGRAQGAAPEPGRECREILPRVYSCLEVETNVFN